MKKIILLLAYSIFFYSAFSQDSKHSLSLGLGIENAYNEMVLPHNFNGASFNINYDCEKYGKGNWNSFIDLGLHISNQSLNHNFSNNKRYTTRLHSYHANLDVLFLRKIIVNNRFFMHAGLITSFQGSYQIINDNIIHAPPPFKRVSKYKLGRGCFCIFSVTTKKNYTPKYNIIPIAHRFFISELF